MRNGSAGASTRDCGCISSARGKRNVSLASAQNSLFAESMSLVLDLANN